MRCSAINGHDGSETNSEMNKHFFTWKKLQIKITKTNTFAKLTPFIFIVSKRPFYIRDRKFQWEIDFMLPQGFGLDMEDKFGCVTF